MPDQNSYKAIWKEYNVWQPLLLSVMVILGMVLGYRMHDSGHQISLLEKISTDSNEVVEMGRIEEIIRFIDQKYVDDIDDEALVEELIETIIDKLDPHSVYIPPAKLVDINTEMSGAYVGIGVETIFVRDTMRIVDLFEYGPAKRAGLRPMDAIIAIDDSIVVNRGLSFDEVRKILKRAKSEELKLRVKREDEQLEVKLNAAEVSIPSVEIAAMVTDDIGCIKINKFTSKTYQEFALALEELYDRQNLKHLIIDVRNNPGGYLPEATNILSQLFQEKGQMLVYTQGKSEKKSEYKSTGKPFFRVDKVAVLIDEGSASGSEILAGAIQDWDRGVIIGRRSFGKGLVQEQYELSNGGAIRLTIAKYFTPSGRSIQKSYEEKDAYYTELDERYASGEQLNGLDSVSLTELPKFKTKRLGREIPGLGGIVPDIFVPIDTFYSHPKLESVYNHLEAYVFDTWKSIKAEYESKAAFESDFTFDESRIKELKNYIFNAGGEVDKDFFEEFGNKIVEELQLMYAHLVFNRDFKNKLMLIQDPAVIEAIRTMESKDILADLISTPE